MKTGEAFLLIQKAIQSGGEYADVFLESKHQTHIVLENKTIDQIFSGKITGKTISNLLKIFLSNCWLPVLFI